MATSTITTSSNLTASTVVTSFADIHNSLISVGLVQTSDTGQMTFPYTAPSSFTANQLLGYTIYRFNDSYQSTYPIYLRIEWRTAQPTYANKIGYSIIVGSGTNGSGTITGSQINTSTFNNGSLVSGSNATSNTYISFSNGNLNIAITPYNQPVTWNSWFFGISRIIDSTGTTKNGYWVTTSRGNDSASEKIYTDNRTTQGVFVHGTGTSGSPLNAPFLWGSEISTMQIGTDIPFFTPTVLDPAVRSTLGFIYIPIDIGSDIIFNTTRYNTIHTYKSLSSASNTSIYQPHNLPARYGFAMLWE